MPKWFSRAAMLLTLAGALAIFTVAAGPALAHPDCDAHDVAEGAEPEECAFEEYEAEAMEGAELGEPVGDAVNGDSFGGPFTWTPNMTPLGFSARPVTGSTFNSDLGFWGDLAVQGTYAGFRLIDISNPADPVQLVNYTACSGSQGDVLVWGNLLIRSWDAPASGTATCGGALVGSGFEGLSLFDISNPAVPVFLRNIRMASNTSPAGAGSHTATLVPDLARGNLYVYVSASSGSNLDIVRIPIADPMSAVYVRREPAGRGCHDTSVILGDVNLVMCAGGNGFTVWRIDPSINPPAAGSLEDPVQLYTRSLSGVSIGHSGSFTWDGEVLIFGHEPGGGGQAQCQASSSTVNRSIFFFDADTGTQLGSFVHPRPQGAQENCTWHNFNVVPTYTGYVFVSGNYQSGISVVDFSNPAAAREIAFADPARLGTGSSITTGGDWSTYWYNGFLYESDIRRGLITWKLDDVLVNRARTVGHSNPQTQEFSFALDFDAPSIDIGVPADGGQYLLGSEVLADFSCTDANSGVESCVGTNAVGEAIDTSSVGNHDFTVTATDAAGNTASKTVTYNVHWPFAGFFPPIDNGVVNVAQAGSAVPVKFDLGGDRGLDVLAAGYPKSQAVPCAAETPQVSVEETVTAGQSSFRYTGEHYQYVWKTEKAWGGTCRELVVKLVDNTTHSATFRFKK